MPPDAPAPVPDLTEGWPRPPEAPKRRVSESPKDTKATEAPKPPKVPDPNKEKEHNLSESEVAPIHRALSRIVGKVGEWLGYEDWTFTPDEIQALNAHGARFLSKWIRTSWAASGVAYGATGFEIAGARAWDAAFGRKREVRPGTRTEETPQYTTTPTAPVAASTPVATTPTPDGSKPAPIPIDEMIDEGAVREGR